MTFLLFRINTKAWLLKMISASALQQVKLKTTDQSVCKDRSAPNLTLVTGASKEKEETRRHYFFETGVDRWYVSLKDETFLTEFVEITPNEARVIVQHWEKNFQNLTRDDPDPDPSQMEIPALLQPLCNRIGTVITRLPTKKGAFVKLSTRSPKDSHVAFAKARKSYLARCPSLDASASINEKLILLSEVVIESLKVTSGEEAIKLLISSDRVGEDLQYALESGDDDFTQRISIVVREWVEIPLWAEFRGFVWDGNLTSIGQYNHPVMFPILQEQALVASVESDIVTFFHKIKAQIALDHYIIDFAWTKDRVYLVEVNPFDGEIVFPASTGLWSWEKDKEQMMKGPLELRIRETKQSPHILKNVIDPKWRDVVVT